MNLNDLGMYFKYLKKCIRLSFLNAFKGIDFKGRIKDMNPMLRGYEGCYPVNKILKQLDIKECDSIMDIGCGKGLFLYYARKYPFKKIVGIEYSKKLSNIAIKNMNNLNDNRIKIINTDARIFSQFEEYNYFFINNPFSSDVMNEFIERILECRKEKKTTVIYQFPFAKEFFLRKGFKIFIDKYPNLVLQYDPK